MSEIVTRQNIEAIDAISLSASSQALSAATVLIDGIAKIGNAAIRELLTGSIEMKHTALNKSVAVQELHSPNSLRADFSVNYLSCMNSIKDENIPVLTKQKITALNTVIGMNYVVKDNAVIQEKLQQVISADSKGVNASVETLMNEIQSQHSTVFSAQLQTIVKLASAEAGFKNVSVKIKNAVPIISALNEKGQGIISEIHTDRKTKTINLVSETTDFFQGECTEAMSKFDEALKKYGVKVAQINRKWTGGNCWIPTKQETKAKVEQNDGKKELDRTRRLNKQNRIKH
jgi:hypothetical protein